MNYFKKESTCRNSLLRISAAAVLSAILLLSGCSGTGTMYTPESAESSSTGITAGDEFAAETPGEESSLDSTGDKHPRHKKDRKDSEDPDEEPRSRSAELEGTGSDLFTAETIDYYYNFTLESSSFRLPCSFSDFSAAGWELVIPETEDEDESETRIRSYSYEFFDAVPAGENTQGLFQKSNQDKKIRLCLANFTDSESSPVNCTVCGISVDAKSGFSLLTTFKEGLGSSISDLSSVFGTDSAIYSVTSYKDGTKTLKYRFSNGLTEGEKISVLAEAEEKSLGELMLAETDEKGSKVTNLSLYYFRLPK